MEMSDSSPLSRSGTSSACWSPGSSWSPSTSLASCSPMQNVNPAEELLEKASALPAILENGRKVFGPPLDYAGLRPSYICELYVANLPKSLDEVHFLAWLYRCGEVYEMRLMMESFSLSRGYAFVRYTQEIEALAAYELLKFVFVDGERLSVYRSQGKNRLYVSNIPKQLPLSSLEAGFKNAFHDMERCTAHASSATDSIRGDLNRGFAFIEFYDHETALQAKKRTTPGRMRMWGNDLKVQWAKPKSLQFNSSSNEITKPRSLGHRASLPNDYNAKLRLYCLANNWCIPVVVYGRCFRERGIQYGGILLKDSTSGELSCMVMELAVDHEIQDVHIAMCEIATLLIEENFGFPKYHYIVRLLNGFRAEILYSCCNNLDIL
ncbi:PREDICTED: probable RNA-binding protein 46, partial [Rhagoletis zephyria]|uniref:probable RNA-binding protein 46 n=1 Tax=Rhagoletis zephyria TaxID=28612 RepID=UPI0008116B8A